MGQGKGRVATAALFLELLQSTRAFWKLGKILQICDVQGFKASTGWT